MAALVHLNNGFGDKNLSLESCKKHLQFDKLYFSKNNISERTITVLSDTILYEDIDCSKDFTAVCYDSLVGRSIGGITCGNNGPLLSVNALSGYGLTEKQLSQRKRTYRDSEFFAIAKQRWSYGSDTEAFLHPSLEVLDWKKSLFPIQDAAIFSLATPTLTQKIVGYLRLLGYNCVDGFSNVNHHVINSQCVAVVSSIDDLISAKQPKLNYEQKVNKTKAFSTWNPTAIEIKHYYYHWLDFFKDKGIIKVELKHSIWDLLEKLPPSNELLVTDGNLYAYQT